MTHTRSLEGLAKEPEPLGLRGSVKMAILHRHRQAVTSKDDYPGKSGRSENRVRTDRLACSSYACRDAFRGKALIAAATVASSLALASAANAAVSMITVTGFGDPTSPTPSASNCQAAVGANQSCPSLRDAELAAEAASTASNVPTIQLKGKDELAFEGRLSRSRKLTLGGYTVVVEATASGETSAKKMLKFTIVH